MVHFLFNVKKIPFMKISVAATVRNPRKNSYGSRLVSVTGLLNLLAMKMSLFVCTF